jgi:TetR/AcrR family transcriptional regulator, transcriptional repressor of aconitase
MPKVTEEYREARRAEILAAARRCFIRQGFQETSMPDILAEAGVSSGAVYNYFRSKEEMIVAIAKENISQVISVLREAATGPHRGSPGAALAHVLDEIRAKHIDDGFAAITVMVWSEALRNPALAAQLTALRGEMGAYYGGLATDIRLPAGVPAESFATVLGSISAGFILQLALFGPDAAEDQPATARALWPAAKAGSVRSPVTTRSNRQTR